ncbi:hypothetical protein ACT3SZ_15995 [Corynebacterium sp. AOP40-9SA-29]|uniref:hypothetical protein n=1 Tax=Corynebacterium sp. AOP40-9SA-29 TaxID=3457677 RepID=UPI0040347A65
MTTRTSGRRTWTALSTAALLAASVITGAAAAAAAAAPTSTPTGVGTISTTPHTILGTDIPTGAAIDWRITLPGPAISEGDYQGEIRANLSPTMQFCTSTDSTMLPLSASFVDDSTGDELGTFYAVYSPPQVNQMWTTFTVPAEASTSTVTFTLTLTLCTASGTADPAGTTYQLTTNSKADGPDNYHIGGWTSARVTATGDEDNGPDVPPTGPPSGSLGSLSSLTQGSL